MADRAHRAMVLAVRWLSFILLALSMAAVRPATANDLPHPEVGAAPTHAHAELIVDPTLTLGEVVRIAAARAPGAQVVEAISAEADAFRQDARRWLADPPSLAFMHVSDAVGRNDGYRQWDTLLELPLWWPGQRAPRREKADAAEAVAVLAGPVHRLEVAARVRETLAGLELARIRLELARTELEAEEALAAKVARAVDLGELAERDRLLAESASLEQRMAVLEALEEHRHSEAEYQLLTGLDRLPAEWGETLATGVGLEEHPALMLARDESEVARAEVERLERGRWGSPVLAVGSQNERDAGNEDYSNRLVAGMRIPLGRRDQVASGVAAARRVLAEAQRDAERLAIALESRKLRAEHGLALVDERMQTARGQAEVSAEHLQLTERGVGFGEGDLASLIRARAWANNALQTLQEVEILRLLRIAEYNQAVGVVP